MRGGSDKGDCLRPKHRPGRIEAAIRTLSYSMVWKAPGGSVRGPGQRGRSARIALR